MVRMTRSRWLFAGSALVCCLSAALVTSMSRAAAPRDDVKDQKLQQQNTQLATEDVAQRIGTMLRVLDYYQPDKAHERKTLERVATTLVSLSREQMEEVLKGLDRASIAPNPEMSAKELKDAHDRHVEIMQTLRSLMAQYEIVNNLEQIADKFDKLAKSELELSLQSNKLGKDIEERPNMYQQGFGGGFGKGGKGFQGIMFNQDLKQLETEQNNLRDDFGKLLKKANDLKARLPAEQSILVDKLNVAVQQTRIDNTLTKANQKLDSIDGAFYADQPDRLREANGLQRKAAEDLKDLASMLWQSKDFLAALRKAQDQLDQSIRQQQDLQDQAKQQAEKDLKDPPRPQAQPDFQDFPRGGKGKKGGGQFGAIRDGTAPPMVDDRGAKEMSDQQARLALDTRDTSNLLKPFAIDVADQIDTARKPMKKAEDALLGRTPDKAVRPQDEAVEVLKEARAKVADLIAQAENKKKDPIAALKDATETIEKLLKDQIATRAQTQDAGDAKQMDKLPQIAPQQKDLANRTESLNNQPMPAKTETKQALDKASKAMDNAAKSLQNQKAPAAVSKQSDAIKSLEDAKKSIQQQIAEMEKRREDIAKLEDATQKLDKLTKDEGQIADQAKDKGHEPQADTKDLGKKQGELTPQAKDLAKELDKLVPKAADKVNQGAQKMDTAQKQLDKNQAKPGAQEAAKAVDKLKEAQAEVAKNLDDLKSKELADQAAMKNINPAAAMQQLQKAMDQTKQAMQQAQKATDQAGQKNLAQLQKELADEAKQKNLDNPALPAHEAAKDLAKGDLTKALQDQQQALDKFQAATPNAGKPQLPPEAMKNQLPPAQAKLGDPYKVPQAQAKQPQQPQAAQAKQGDPQDGRAAQAKQGDPDQGEEGQTKQGQKADQPAPQAAQVKAGQSEQQGQAKPGQPPQAQAKAGEAQQGQIKTGQQGQSATQLEPEQKALMDAVRQLAQKQAEAREAQQSQQANQGAMQALGQAMAGSPQGAQKQMQQAANKLGQAGQQLGKGSPQQAAQAQQQAMQQMQKAMQQMQGAQAAQAKQGQGKDGKDGKDGKGKQGDGKGQQAKGQGDKQGNKQGNAQEKNDAKANGNRIADGKVSNTQSQLQDVTGEDTFLQLPARQRELIRQALAGELPPEYAAQIQQYYLNISRGRSAVMPPPPPR
jgi:hypothetical protein